MGDFINFTKKTKKNKKYVLYVDGFLSPEYIEAILDLWFTTGNTEPLLILPNDWNLEVLRD